MNVVISLSILCVLFILELIYFKIADKYNIVDKPNHRSSHRSVTLRGGGIIFSLSMMIHPFYYGFTYSYFILGLILIGFISFLDDISPVTSKFRIVVHLLAVSLMFQQLMLFGLPFYWIILSLFLVIGSINAINFMDGINGITGSFAFVTLCTLLFINCCVVKFVESEIIITAILSVIVFNFFNFRTKAKCFAGDVGSVGIAFIIMFFLLSLIIKTQNIGYLLLLLLYGLDTVTTIAFRLVRRERVLEPHRSHFYQYWANEKKVSHLLVASVYAIIQVLINILVIYYNPLSPILIAIVLVVSGMIFLICRFSTEGKSKLLKHAII